MRRVSRGLHDRGAPKASNEAMQLPEPLSLLLKAGKAGIRATGGNQVDSYWAEDPSPLPTRPGLGRPALRPPSPQLGRGEGGDLSSLVSNTFLSPLSGLLNIAGSGLMGSGQSTWYPILTLTLTLV